MYHPRFKGDHFEMGQKLGSIFLKAGARFSITLDNFQQEHGRRSGRILKDVFPEAVAEIKGITDSLGYNNELFTSWLMCMGCCLDLHDEESFEVRGCTAFSFESAGRYFHGRDNDLPPFLKKTSMSIFYAPENGNRFILNTSSFVNGEEGINEYGLVVAMTFVKPFVEEIRPGLNSVFIVRYLLEKCSSTDEALSFLENLPVASSCNIILTDRKGKMAVAECNPARVNVRHPEKNQKGEPFIVTVNHFTSEGMWKHDAGNRDLFFSGERYRTAFDALKNMDYSDPEEHAKNILSGKYGFMCQYDKRLNFDTIWSSVFDITVNKVFRAEGNPAKKKYVEDKRLQFR
jgi:predicted choloylglycine hydrolase